MNKNALAYNISKRYNLTKIQERSLKVNEGGGVMQPLRGLYGSLDLHLEKGYNFSTAPPESPLDKYEEVFRDELENLFIQAGIGRGFRIFLDVGLDILGKIGVPTQTLGDILFRIPDKTPTDGLIDSIFKTAESFSSAVIEIKDGWQDMTPEAALKKGLDWIYSNHRRFCAGENSYPALSISVRDIEILKAKYNFTNDQLFNALFEINQTYGWLYKFMGEEIQYRELWDNIYSAIVDSGTTGGNSPELVGTQELLRKGIDELGVSKERVTKILFERIIRKLSVVETLGNDPVEIVLGNETLTINNPQDALERMYSILKKINNDKRLNGDDLSFIDGLKNGDETIRQIYDVATKPVRDRIVGRENFIKLVHLSESGGDIAKGLTVFIEKISTGTETVLLIVQNASGQQVMPRMMVRSLGNGERFAQYERPYYVEPFSYHFGTVYFVKGETVSQETAVVAKDGNGKEFFITRQDMRQFSMLARTIVLKKGKKSELARATLRFFNVVQTIFLSVDPTYEPAEGSPLDISKRAEALKKTNWIGKFERDVNVLLEDFFNTTTRVLGNQIDYENGRLEAMETSLHERTLVIYKEYLKYCGKSKEKEFSAALRLLERGIILKKAEMIENAVGRLKKISTQQVSGNKAGTAWVRSQDIAGDLRILREMTPEMFQKYENSSEEAPQAIRNFTLVWGSSADMEPNLQKARALLKEGSYEKAFTEYEKIIKSAQTSTELRFIALSELARESYAVGQLLRSARALERIDNMMLIGRKLPPEARKILKGFISRVIESDPLLRLDVPANLKKGLLGNAQNGTASPKRPPNLVRRFEKLPEAIRKEIGQIIEKWGGAELLGYRTDFLRDVAMCHSDAEAVSFAKIESPEELALVKKFRSEVALAMGPFGFQRYVGLSVEAKKRLEKLISSWAEFKAYGRDVLRTVALATDFEIGKVMETFKLAEDMSDFRKLSGEIVDREKFTNKKSEEPVFIRVEERPDMKLGGGVYEGKETVIDGQLVKPWYVSYGHKTYMIARDVGGSALLGAVTFLTAEQAVSLIAGEPKTHMEAFIHQYDIIGTAVLMEHGMQKAVEYVARGGTGYSAVPAAATGLSVSGFVGGIGTAMFVYKGVNEIAETAGLSGRAAEVTSLVGTGVLLGGWQPAVRKIFGDVKGGEIIKGVGKVMTKGGTILFILDAVPTATEAVYNLFDDKVSVVAREQWYACLKETGYARGISGSAKNVAWYERIGQSIYNGLDDLLVPASWHKMAGPVVDKVSAGWINGCEGILKSGRECPCVY